jgi:methionine-R-sulfoxide reductase
MTKPALLPLLLAPFLALALSTQAADPAPAKETAQPKEPAKVNKDELRNKLTPMQYKVACEGGTEPPFRNAYWDNHEPGLYVDVISGEPLFASVHKFDSGTGWPSFTQTLKKDAVKEVKDASHGMVRVEVRSTKADAHLGHVFNDGPTEAGGMRYCINSASLRFIPVAKLKESGYGEYAALFDKKAEAPKK